MDFPSIGGARHATAQNQALAAASKAADLYGYMTFRRDEQGEQGDADKLADLLVDLAEEYGADVWSAAVERAAPLAKERGVELGQLVTCTTRLVEIPDVSRFVGGLDL